MLRSRFARFLFSMTLVLGSGKWLRIPWDMVGRCKLKPVLNAPGSNPALETGLCDSCFQVLLSVSTCAPMTWRMLLPLTSVTARRGSVSDC